jgi:hypothetical protein
LGLHQPVVEGAWVGEGLLDGLFGDLVEDHSPHGHLGLEHLDQMPSDRLALPVLIGGQVELVGLRQQLLQLLDLLLSLLGDDVERFEALIHVDTEASPVLTLRLRRDLRSGAGQISDVPHRRFHGRTLAEKRRDGAGLGG